MTGPVRVLELRSVRGPGGGPEKTILLGAARSDPARVAVTVCYLRDARDRVYDLDRRARELPVDYVEVIERHSFDPRIWPALRALIRSRRIDVIHAHEYKTDLLALLLARVEGVMPLATVHGWSGDSLRERVYYAADERLLKYYPLVITVSPSIREVLLRRGAQEDRVRYVPNGVDTRMFAPDADARARVRAQLGVPDEVAVLGAVGRLEKEKRFDLLLQVAARVGAGRPVVVAIAGEGSQRGALEQTAAALGLDGRLRLLGQRRDVCDVHRAFDIYVQTSDREGCPNAVLEAMAVQTPVVATDVGGTGELIVDGETGLLAPRGDVERLVAAVDRALTDTETPVRAARARAWVERERSFDARMAAVEDIYRGLVDRGRRSHRRAA